MSQVLSKSNFSILLKSSGADDSSEYWQEQCYQLYDSICSSLPEGSIELLNLEGSQGKGVDLITVFSTLAAFGLTGEVFVDVVFDSIKTWLEYRPTAEIKLNVLTAVWLKFQGFFSQTYLNTLRKTQKRQYVKA